MLSPFLNFIARSLHRRYDIVITLFTVVPRYDFGTRIQCTLIRDQLLNAFSKDSLYKASIYQLLYLIKFTEFDYSTPDSTIFIESNQKQGYQPN